MKIYFWKKNFFRALIYLLNNDIKKNFFLLIEDSLKNLAGMTRAKASDCSGGVSGLNPGPHPICIYPLSAGSHRGTL